MAIRRPRPQRELRTPTTRPRTPSTLSLDHHIRLAHRLTSRDRWLIRMLHEHRVLTTDQITTMAFPSPRSARHRLLELYRWNVIDRFQPLIGVGSAPLHYVLGGAGAGVLAAVEAITVRALGYRRDDVLAIAHRHTLAHTVAVNDVLAHLVHHTTTHREVRLVAWWSETRCTRYVGDLVRPDAYGRITLPPPKHRRPDGADPDVGDLDRGGRSFEWFFELDFGTEPLARLTAKLDRYAQLAAAAHPTPVLFWLPTPRREAHAREHLVRALRRLERPDLVPVAITTPSAEHDEVPAASSPTEPYAWLPVDLDRQPDPAHTRGGGSATARVERATRFGLAGLAALWPPPPGQSHADLATAERARARAVELPAPDPVPPDPATFNPAAPSAARSTARPDSAAATTSESDGPPGRAR